MSGLLLSPTLSFGFPSRFSVFQFRLLNANNALGEIRQTLHWRIARNFDFHPRCFFPRLSCGADSRSRLGQGVSGQLGVHQALTEYLRARLKKTNTVRQFAIVEPIRLFIKVAK